MTFSRIVILSRPIEARQHMDLQSRNHPHTMEPESDPLTLKWRAVFFFGIVPCLSVVWALIRLSGRSFNETAAIMIPVLFVIFVLFVRAVERGTMPTLASLRQWSRRFIPTPRFQSRS